MFKRNIEMQAEGLPTGCPVVKTLPFHCRGLGLIPGRGKKFPQAVWTKKKKKKKKNKKKRKKKCKMITAL